MLHRGILFLLFFLLSSLMVCAQSPKSVKGYVFNDINRNGVFDATDKPLQGIAVSNQQQVVLTDSKGKYELPIDNETTVFVTKPSGYITRIDSLNLPRFYYINQPKGSPMLQYAGLQPTPQLPASLDFPLYAQAEPDTFSILAFGDPQPVSAQEIEYIRDEVVAELTPNTFKFGIVLGDIMFDYLDLFGYYNNVMSQLGIPLYNVPGNHDVNFDATDDHYSMETFKQHYGATYYSFDYANVHFVVLEDIDWKGPPSNNYRGYIDPKQLQWLANDISVVDEKKLIVLCMHIPPYSKAYSGERNYIVNREALFDVIKKRKNLLILAGHMHAIEQYYLSQEHDWTGNQKVHQISCAAACGSWWSGPVDDRGIPSALQTDGTPNGYHIITFKGVAHENQYYGFNLPSDFQIRIEEPFGKISPSDSLLIVANVFNAAPDAIVKATIDQQTTFELQNVLMKSPYTVRAFQQYKDMFKSWITPVVSTHIYRKKIATQLDKGVHTITVRYTDPWGKQHVQSTVFEVE